MDGQNVSIREIFNKFLAFENTGHVLTFRYSYRNMLVWPFVRNAVWNAVYKSIYGDQAGLVDNTAQNMTKGRIRSYKWEQFFRISKNPLFSHQHTDILYLYHVLGNVKDENGVYYNRIYDDFVALHDSTAIIESAPLFRHFYPKKYKTFEADSIEILCAVHEKVSVLKRRDREMIDGFFAYLDGELPFEIRKPWRDVIRVELERYAKNMSLIYGYYRKVFMKHSPKLVFVAQGCDGSHMACKIKVLRDLGIPSAEIQHGLISERHFAYNYSQAIFDSTEYREYMPDYFLTFGHFWEQSIRLPVKTVVLGNANFNRNFNSAPGAETGEVHKEISPKERNILILPSDTEPYAELIGYIRAKLPDRKIFVKVHPTKTQQYETLKKLEDDHVGVYIKENINDFFSQTEIVIGDGSTALYEAAALGRQVMIWDTERSASIHRAIGTWFRSKEDVVEVLRAEQSETEPEIKPEDIFARDSEERYRSFISKYVSETNGSV